MAEEIESPSGLDSIPEITLRISGPWQTPEEFSAVLARADANYAIVAGDTDNNQYVVHQPTGRRFKLGVIGPDDEIVELFADTARLSPSELRALRNHRVKVFLSGPGGSLEGVRAFLAIGAVMVRAGGLGVMVDNSGNCHGPRDWLDLASDKGLGGMYWAFVSVAAAREEIFSSGMHCLGFRDAEIPDPFDRQTDGMKMHEFLGYTYQSGVAIVDGDPIGGPEGAEFILRHVPCTRFEAGSPWFNPYGVWRLEKVEEGQFEGDGD